MQILHKYNAYKTTAIKTEKAFTSCSGKESTRIEGPVQRPEGPPGPALLVRPEDPGTKDFLKGLVIP